LSLKENPHKLYEKFTCPNLRYRLETHLCLFLMGWDVVWGLPDGWPVVWGLPNGWLVDGWPTVYLGELFPGVDTVFEGPS
jgi:hypothetical protein